MGDVVRFPTKQSRPTPPDPAARLLKNIATVTVSSGLPRRDQAAALRRIASALERREA
jgi:hypothetical protein